jgi:large subunit ribosomal protein L24
MLKLKIKKGDTVKVLAGKDKGKVGEIVKAFPKENKVLVSGVNEVKKHTKPSKTSQGGIVAKAMPIHVSNVMFFDKKNNKASKIGYKFLDDGTKKRVMKISGEIIE